MRKELEFKKGKRPDVVDQTGSAPTSQPVSGPSSEATYKGDRHKKGQSYPNKQTQRT